MRIELNGNTYDLSEAVSKAKLNDLMELKLKTQSTGEGVSVKSIRGTFMRMGDTFKAMSGQSDEMTDEQMAEALSEAFLELLSDAEFVRNFVGVIFLARRRAGEKVTVEEAGEFAFSDIHFIPPSEEAGTSEQGDDAAPFTDPGAAPAPTT